MSSIGPLPSNPSKIELGSIEENKKALTIKDYVSYTNSSGIGRILSKIVFLLRGKGLVDEKSLHDLAVKNLGALKTDELSAINSLADRVLKNENKPSSPKEEEKMVKETACAHAAHNLVEDAIDYKDNKARSTLSFLKELGYEGIQQDEHLKDLFNEYIELIKQPAILIETDMHHKNHIVIEDAINILNADSSEDSGTVYSEVFDNKDIANSHDKPNIARSDSIDEDRKKNLRSSRRVDVSLEDSDTEDELETAVKFILADEIEGEDAGEDLKKIEKSTTLTAEGKTQIVESFVEYLAERITEQKLSLEELELLQGGIESLLQDDKKFEERNEQHDNIINYQIELKNTSQERERVYYRSLQAWKSLESLGNYSTISSSPLKEMLLKYETNPQTRKPLTFQTSQNLQKQFVNSFLDYLVGELLDDKLNLAEIRNLKEAVKQNTNDPPMQKKAVLELLTQFEKEAEVRISAEAKKAEEDRKMAEFMKERETMKAEAEAKRAAAELKKEKMSSAALERMTLSDISSHPVFREPFSDFISEFGNMIKEDEENYFKMFKSLNGNINNAITLQGYLKEDGEKYTLDLTQVHGVTAQLFKDMFWEYLAFSAQNI